MMAGGAGIACARPAAVAPGAPPGTGCGMGLQVTEVQKALKGADYPATRDDLVGLAKSNGADDEVVQALQNMNKDSFDGPSAVMEAVKGDLGGSTS